MSIKSVFAAMGCVALAACGGSGSGSPTTEVQEALFDVRAINSGPALSTDTGSDDTNFADILNGLRLSRGHEEMTYDARLDAAAQKYAVEQSIVDEISHTGVDGSSLSDRIIAEGYVPSSAAENIARGHQNQAVVLQAWMDSPGHNANLNRDMENFALGVAGSGSRLAWVLVLATER